MKIELNDEQAMILLRALELQASAARSLRSPVSQIADIEEVRGHILSGIGDDMLMADRRARSINKAIDEFTR